MVRIQLETGYLDVSEGTLFPLNFGVAEIRDVSKRSGTFSKSIKCPGTDNNNILLNHYYDVNIEEGSFNLDTLTKCAVIQNGIPILEDCYLQLVSVDKTQDSDGHDERVEYTVLIKDAQADFFTKLDNKELTELDFTDLNHTYSAANVVASFSNVYTDGYVYPMCLSGDNNYELIEFRPAIYAKTYWDRIHSNAGFSYTWSTQAADLFTKAIIPYNGDTPEVDYSEYITEEEKTSFTASLGSVITSWTEINDPNNLFNNTTGIYSVPFYIGSGQSINFEVDITFDLKLVNGTGANAYLVDMLSTASDEWIRYRPKLDIYKNSTTFIGSVNLFPTAQVDFGKWFESDNPLANGTTTIESSVSVVSSVGFSNFLPTDTLDFRLRLETDGSQALVWLKWKDAASTSGNDVTITQQLDVSSINLKTSVSTNALGFGQTVVMNDLVPRKIKQKDFVKSICTMWNLYVEPDKDNPNKLVYKTRDDFYDAGAEKDWTKKLMKERTHTLAFLPDLTAKKIQLSYKQDKDAYNVTYEEATNEVYGQVEFTYTNEYVKGIDRKEVIFSPTPMTDTPYGAIVPAIVGVAPKNNIRILLHNGTTTCNAFNIYDYATTGQTGLTDYPLVSHFDDHFNPSFDLNFGVCDYYFYQGITLTNNNMFNNYWRRTISQINNGKMLTAYFDLRESDIQTLSLNDKIRIDNSWWFINRVIDYNANDNVPTKVELLSVDTEFTAFDERETPPPPLGFTNPNNPIGELIEDANLNTNNNNSPGKTVIYGKGNTIAPNVNALVLGDNGYIDSDGVWLNGEKISGADSNSRTYNSIRVDANYTVDPNYDEYIITITACTVTMPDARSYSGKLITVKNTDSSDTTITSTISNQIDGQTNLTLTQYDSVSMFTDGSTWNIV